MGYCDHCADWTMTFGENRHACRIKPSWQKDGWDVQVRANNEWEGIIHISDNEASSAIEALNLAQSRL